MNENDLTQTLDMLEAMLWQDCGSTKNDSFEVNFISIHAEAARHLAKYGRVILDPDYGGRYVTGVFTNPQPW